MSTRSHRLAGPVLFTASFEVAATVPDSEVWIVKNIRVLNATAGALEFDLTVNGDNWATALFWGTPIDAKSVLTDGTWQVLEPGDVVSVRAPDPDGLVMWLSGARLPA